MKSLKRIIAIIFTAVLFADSFSASAISFDAEKIYNSVFVITSGNSLGSGFAVGENCLVTNAHVIGNKKDIVLTTYSGESYKAFLIGMDSQKDIAVLGVKDTDFTPLIFDDCSSTNIGDDVYAIGAPKSMTYTLTKGVLSAKEREVGRYTYIQTDAAVNEGNSGGPLLNENGDVIGMNTLKMMDSEGIGLAIPSSAIIKYLKSLDIKTDESGNVSNQVEPNSDGDYSTDSNATNDFDEEDRPQSENSSSKIIVWAIALLVSVTVNIILAIALIAQRKKNLTLKYDPRERTDFEVEILE